MTSSSTIRRAYLFNFEKFDDSCYDRKNSSADIKKFTEAIPDRAINFTEYYDCTKARVNKILNQIAKANHDNDAYLLFLFSSHGDANGILTRDGYNFPVQEIIEKFVQCSVPTIFIFQACRGEEIDRGVEAVLPMTNNPDLLLDDESEQFYTVKDSIISDFLGLFSKKAKTLEESTFVVNSSLKTISTKMPKNCVVAFSTPPGRYSWRFIRAGGVFLRELAAAIQLFRQNNEQLDVVKLLKFTNFQVGFNKYDYVKSDSRTDESQCIRSKQIGEIISTLTQPLILF